MTRLLPLRGRSLAGALLLVSGAAAAAAAAPPAAPPAPDPRAVEIARRTLDQIESGWALARYDQADRVRASLNLRGGAPTPVGLTANAVVDRRGRRYRVDVAGDVGPLTLWADARRVTLFVPALQQVGRRQAGALAPAATLGASLTAELRAMRARLDAGYTELSYIGDETLGGVLTHRIQDTPEPGVTATYWIDADRSLPRRISIARAGARPTRFDFGYGSGPRPTRIDASLPGTRDVQATIVPRYDSTGRATHLRIESRIAGGGSYSADVVLDWSPRTSADFFQPSVPPGTQEVGFEQLAGGVLFAAAGKLSGLASAILGATGLGSR